MIVCMKCNQKIAEFVYCNENIKQKNKNYTDNHNNEKL